MGVAFVISSALPASEVIEVDRQNRQARRNAGMVCIAPPGQGRPPYTRRSVDSLGLPEPSR